MPSHAHAAPAPLQNNLPSSGKPAAPVKQAPFAKPAVPVKAAPYTKAPVLAKTALSANAAKSVVPMHAPKHPVAVRAINPTAFVHTTKPTTPLHAIKPTTPLHATKPATPVHATKPTAPVHSAKPTTLLNATKPSVTAQAIEPTAPVYANKPTAPVYSGKAVQCVASATPSHTFKPNVPVNNAKLAAHAHTGKNSTLVNGTTPKSLCHAPRAPNASVRVVAAPPIHSKNSAIKPASAPPSNSVKPSNNNDKVINRPVGHVSITFGSSVPSRTATGSMDAPPSNDWGVRHADLADMDFEKWSARIADALFFRRPLPFPAHHPHETRDVQQAAISEPLTRHPILDPRYPPPTSEAAILWRNAPETEDDLPAEDVNLEDEDKIPEAPFEAFQPSRDVLLEVLHEEIGDYHPDFVCVISSRMVDTFSPVQLLELLRYDPDKIRESVESTLSSVLEKTLSSDDLLQHRYCSRCSHADASTGSRIKHSLRDPLISRVKTRHPFMAEDIVDTILEEVLIEILNLLLHPFALLAEIIGIVDGCFTKLQARSRRKALREDMKVRIMSLQPDKHAKVLAVIMREKDDSALLDMLRYPKLLQERVKQCLSIVREGEEATREKRIAKRHAQQLAAAAERETLKAKSVALAGSSLNASCGKKVITSADIKSQMNSATLAQKMMLKPAVSKQTAVRTMALQKSPMNPAVVNRKPNGVTATAKPVGAVNAQNLSSQQLAGRVAAVGATATSVQKRKVVTVPNGASAKKQKPAALVPPSALGGANGTNRVLHAPGAIRQVMTQLPKSTMPVAAPTVAPPPALVQPNILAAHKPSTQPLRVQQYVPSASPARPAVSKPAAKRRKVTNVPAVQHVQVIGAPTTMANVRKTAKSVGK